METRSNEQQNALRKRMSEELVPEEPPKRLRLSEERSQKTLVTQDPDGIAGKEPAGVTAIEQQLAAVLLELKSHERVTASKTTADHVTPLIQTLLVSFPSRGQRGVLTVFQKEASPDMIQVLTRPHASGQIEQEKQQLMVLSKLISVRLMQIVPPDTTPTPPAEPAECAAASEPRATKPVQHFKQQQRGKQQDTHSDLHHEMDDKEFNELMDADMDGAFEVDEDQAVAMPHHHHPSQSAPIAPMAPMMSMPMAPIAPIAPMAPMAFMKPSTPMHK